MIFGLCEFTVTILVAVLLYAAMAVLLYLDALLGSLKRAAALLVWRFRVGAIVNSASESAPATGAPLSEAPTRGPVGRGRFHFWLN